MGERRWNSCLAPEAHHQDSEEHNRSEVGSARPLTLLPARKYQEQDPRSDAARPRENERRERSEPKPDDATSMAANRIAPDEERLLDVVNNPLGNAGTHTPALRVRDKYMSFAAEKHFCTDRNPFRYGGGC
jgi:hypothetical protein